MIFLNLNAGRHDSSIMTLKCWRQFGAVNVCANPGDAFISVLKNVLCAMHNIWHATVRNVHAVSVSDWRSFLFLLPGFCVFVRIGTPYTLYFIETHTHSHGDVILYSNIRYVCSARAVLLLHANALKRTKSATWRGAHYNLIGIGRGILYV